MLCSEMSTLTEPADGVWLPLPEAAAALGCSVDTVRRRIKRGDVQARMRGTRYVVHVHAGAPGSRAAGSSELPAATFISVEDVHPSVKALLDYVKERDLVRDREVAELRAALARAQADLAAQQAALPNGKPWSPFAWIRQLWAAQT